MKGRRICIPFPVHEIADQSNWSPLLERVREPDETCEVCQGDPGEGWVCLACLGARASTLSAYAVEVTLKEETEERMKTLECQLARLRPTRADGTPGYGPLTDDDVIFMQSKTASRRWLESKEFRNAMDRGWIRFAS